MNIIADPIEARLLDILQRGIPLVSRPFDEIAAQLEIPTDDVISRITRLKSNSIIRQISAIFDSAALGYRSALVAFRLEDSVLDSVGEALAAHPGISHCYSRDAEYNLWFTLTIGPEQDIDAEARRLADSQNVESYLILPTIKMFKIAVFLSMADNGQDAASPTPAPSPRENVPISERDRAAVRALQQDMELVREPFVEAASKAGMTEDELLERARYFRQNGIMRRFAAVLKHQRAGYRVNAMICWQVEAGEVEELGTRFAADPAVSHCYQRPVYPDWPYPLYTMVHCRSEEELAQVIRRLTDQAKGVSYRVLRTKREYKKSRVIYF